MNQDIVGLDTKSAQAVSRTVQAVHSRPVRPSLIGALRPKYEMGGGRDSSIGTRQYQQRVMVTDNEVGYDVARFASLISNGD